jgi:fructose-1-phosphate kinase PfkB-like protein
VALTYAEAAGTATTQIQGTAVCQKKDFEEILPLVKVDAVGISKKGSKGS